MLPTERSAGVWTAVEGCLLSANQTYLLLAVHHPHEEVHQTSANTALDDSLNLVIRSIRQVRNSPTSVDEDLIVQRVDELGEDG